MEKQQHTTPPSQMSGSCPVCGQKNFRPIGKPITKAAARKFLRHPYMVVSCADCGTYFVDPPLDLTPNEWKELYSSEYFGAQSELLKKQRAAELTRRFARLEKHIVPRGEICFLDVGCGEGYTLAKAKALGWKATGIDIVDHRAEPAKGNDIQFISGSLTDAALPSASIDCAFMDSVLEHVPDPLAHLRELRRVLKPNGILYIGVPNEDCLFNDIRRLAFKLTGKGDTSVRIRPFDEPFHIVGFNRNSLKKAIRDTGFEVLEFRNFGRKMEFLYYPFFSRGFWVGLLLLFPIEYIGYFTGRDIYFDAIIRKTG